MWYNLMCRGYEKRDIGQGSCSHLREPGSCCRLNAFYSRLRKWKVPRDTVNVWVLMNSGKSSLTPVWEIVEHKVCICMRHLFCRMFLYPRNQAMYARIHYFPIYQQCTVSVQQKLNKPDVVIVPQSIGMDGAAKYLTLTWQTFVYILFFTDSEHVTMATLVPWS